MPHELNRIRGAIDGRMDGKLRVGSPGVEGWKATGELSGPAALDLHRSIAVVSV
jgi:hypothetical protein